MTGGDEFGMIFYFSVMLNSFQHLSLQRILNQVQDDGSTFVMLNSVQHPGILNQVQDDGRQVRDGDESGIVPDSLRLLTEYEKCGVIVSLPRFLFLRVSHLFLIYV